MVEIATLEKELSDLGVAREKAAARRQGIFGELRQLSIKAEAGDNKARNAQGPLNKQADEESRLILRIDREMKDIKRSLDLCRGQQAAIDSRAAATVPESEKTRFFDVRTPHGKIVRHKHASIDALRRELQAGYSVAAEIFGCDDEGLGGFPVAVSQRKQLLAALQEMSEA